MSRSPRKRPLFTCPAFCQPVLPHHILSAQLSHDLTLIHNHSLIHSLTFSQSHLALSHSLSHCLSLSHSQLHPSFSFSLSSSQLVSLCFGFLGMHLNRSRLEDLSSFVPVPPLPAEGALLLQSVIPALAGDRRAHPALLCRRRTGAACADRLADVEGHDASSELCAPIECHFLSAPAWENCEGHSCVSQRPNPCLSALKPCLSRSPSPFTPSPMSNLVFVPIHPSTGCPISS